MTDGTMATGIMKPERKNRTRVLAAAAASVVLVAVAMAVVTHSSRSALISIVPAQALYEYHVPGDYLGVPPLCRFKRMCLI
jgi:hypothetical protein